MKIAILIPSTSRGRNWKSIRDSYLYNCLLKSLLLTCDSGHIYHIYLVIDNDDPIYSKTSDQNELLRFTNVFKKLRIHFLSSDKIPKGWVTHMWNRAFQKAYDDGIVHGRSLAREDLRLLREEIKRLKQQILIK